MIHQHIFASPRPGMTEAEFQDYWLFQHAPNFASKISQIKKYKIDRRIPFSRDKSPVWNGIAEIWLRDEADQLASLQSPEFIQGARADEPNWAAFWNSLGLDCDSETIRPGSVSDDGVKLMVLYRRAEGTSLDSFRKGLKDNLVQADLPDVLRTDLALTRDAAYAVGEPRFDAVAHFWFASPDMAEALSESPAWASIQPSVSHVVNPAQIFFMLTRETWVIGPDARP